MLYPSNRGGGTQSSCLRCSLCGVEITPGEEYWACNGFQICGGCFLDFARQELAPFRERRGTEARG